jgi:hypothetical protein
VLSRRTQCGKVNVFGICVLLTSEDNIPENSSFQENIDATKAQYLNELIG